MQQTRTFGRGLGRIERQRERVVIGRMSRQELQAIVFEPAPNMKGYQLSETEAEEIKTLVPRATGQGSSDGRDGQRSPNGHFWAVDDSCDVMIYRIQDGQRGRVYKVTEAYLYMDSSSG